MQQARKKDRPLPVAKLKPDAALEAFQSHAIAYRRQSLLLTCSAAVYLITGQFADRRVDIETSMDRLRGVIKKTGVANSQTAKYVGVARALVSHVGSTKFKSGGPLPHVLRARTADAAVDVLANYLAKERVTTLEGMTKLFGRYRRAPKRPAARKPHAAPATAGKDVRPVRIGAEGRVVRADTRKGAEVLLSSAVLRHVSAEKIVVAAAQAGHSPVTLAAAAVTAMTKQKDLLHLEGLISERLNQVSGKGSRAVPHTPKRRAA